MNTLIPLQVLMDTLFSNKVDTNTLTYTQTHRHTVLTFDKLEYWILRHWTVVQAKTIQTILGSVSPIK